MLHNKPETMETKITTAAALLEAVNVKTPAACVGGVVVANLLGLVALTARLGLHADNKTPNGRIIFEYVFPQVTEDDVARVAAKPKELATSHPVRIIMYESPPPVTFFDPPIIPGAEAMCRIIVLKARDVPQDTVRFKFSPKRYLSE